MDECGSSGVAGTEIVNSPDGYEYDFGIILAQGGQYEVCWCIGIEPYVGCALNSHFGVRVAELVLDGPSGGAIYTCVKNAPCKFIAIQGIHLLEGDDALVASGFCGSTVTIPGVEEEARRTKLTATFDLVYDLKMSSMAPGIYEVCWCRGECSAAEFRVPIGQLTMEGPRLGQSLECVRGHACHLRINGVGLLAGEKLMVTEDCFRPLLSKFCVAASKLMFDRWDSTNKGCKDFQDMKGAGNDKFGRSSQSKSV